MKRLHKYREASSYSSWARRMVTEDWNWSEEGVPAISGLAGGVGRVVGGCSRLDFLVYVFWVVRKGRKASEGRCLHGSPDNWP